MGNGLAPYKWTHPPPPPLRKTNLSCFGHQHEGERCRAKNSSEKQCSLTFWDTKILMTPPTRENTGTFENTQKHTDTQTHRHTDTETTLRHTDTQTQKPHADTQTQIWFEAWMTQWPKWVYRCEKVGLEREREGGEGERGVDAGGNLIISVMQWKCSLWCNVMQCYVILCYVM